MTTGRADGAHIKVNSSFHTLTHQHWLAPGKGGVPEFLDEFGKTGDEVRAVFVESFDVFFVFVCRIDDGYFGEVVHVWTMRFIALSRRN